MQSPRLYLVEDRIKTFKYWPFSDKAKCNVRNMAEAGFYSVATGIDDADAAKCFLCGKELDGWESTDDPWVEHRDHAAKCAFVQIGKNEDDISMSEFMSVVKQFMINEIKRITEAEKEQIDERKRAVQRRCLGRK